MTGTSLTVPTATRGSRDDRRNDAGRLGDMAPEEDLPPTEGSRHLELRLMLIENEVQSSRLHRARQLVTTLLMEMPDATERVVDFAKRTACEQHPEATTMCANALLEAGLQGDRWESMADWVPQQPETAHWPADLNSQLARADAAARLETRRRKNHNHLKTFPDLAPVPTGASETTRDGSSGERDTPGVNRR